MRNRNLNLLKSALTHQNPFNTTAEVIDWLRRRNEEVTVAVERIPFEELVQWGFEQETGNLRHASGKFFSIEGVQIRTNFGSVTEWSQPIINQPEVGYLGIIAREIDGVLYFLMQAKIEPGNINHVQLSPTLQATKSNYTQVHKGARPLYLEYFQNAKPSQVLVDQLQSEQGARFLRKRNRNIIIEVEEEIPVYEDFRWLTLGQIIQLTGRDNTVNMDTRTVLSGIPFGSYPGDVLDFVDLIVASSNGVGTGDWSRGLLYSALDSESARYSNDQILSWLSALKSTYELDVQPIPLRDVDRWVKTDRMIHHEDNKYFHVIAVNVEISNREVRAWTQPLVEPAQEGLCAFIVKKIGGVYHFIVQAKLECGNLDVVELAPTVQCLTGNYRETEAGKLPFLDIVMEADPSHIRFDTMQSEEGGRFFQEQNRNVILEVNEDFPEDLPENYTWMTLNQLKTFLKFNNYLNIQARSLIASIGVL